MDLVLETLAKIGFMFALIMGMVVVLIWMERKGSAFIQDRTGPNRAAIARVRLAGPAHPAFGQLVRSQLWRWALDALPRQRGDVLVHPADLADAVGHRGANRLTVDGHPCLKTLRVDPDVPRGGLRYNGKTWPVDELAREGIVHAA